MNKQTNYPARGIDAQVVMHAHFINHDLNFCRKRVLLTTAVCAIGGRLNDD